MNLFVLLLFFVGVVPYSNLPSTIPGLTAWYDLSNVSSVTVSGGTVSQINDLSGNGNTLTQPTTADQPAYPSTINGLNVATFNGSTTYLTTATTNTFATGSNPDIVFAVAYTTIPTANKGSVWAHGTTTTTAQSRNITKGASNLAYAGESNQDSPNSSQAVSTSVLTLLTGVFGSTTVSISVNGNAFASASATPNTPVSQSATLGKLASGGQYWGGPVGEVIVYSGTLTTENRQQVEGYLACKWGIQSGLPATHPFRNICPYYPNPMFFS